MSITRTDDVHLPQLSPTASDADKRLLQALYEQFRDTNQRLQALEITLGITPRRASGSMQMTETIAPAAPPTNSVRIYAVDNGGKTQLLALFPTGAAQQLAIEP